MDPSRSARGVQTRSELYGRYGPALIITDGRGECGASSEMDLSGFYFRETRYLSRRRLELNGERPWLCSAGGGAQHEMLLTYTHPELRGGTGGGTNSAGEEQPRDAFGLRRRSLDLLARYRLGFHS